MPSTEYNTEWRDIPGFGDAYRVSRDGQVMSLPRRRTRGGVRKPALVKGYLRVSLPVGGHWRARSVHRLVAEAFVPNPEAKPEVNHLNGVTTDNRAENLEWVTKSENISHAYHDLGRKANTPRLGPTAPRAIVAWAAGEQRSFPSTKAAGRAGFDQPSIISCLKGRRRTHRGMRWEYADSRGV